MAKVIGVNIVILSSLALIGQIFLYQNTNVHLPYNPSAPAMGISETGLLLPLAMTLFLLIVGLFLLYASSEPEKI